MKYLFLLLLAILVVDAKPIGLFAKVTGVASDDMLNVRANPNYKARNVGTLPPGAMIGIERCRKIGRSQWCRVYQLVQNYYSDNFHPGWVNAHFLEPSNRGYVRIKERKNDCYYALKCRRERCEVVIGALYDDKDTLTQLQKEWIDRKKLRGESRFGAAADDMEGYCTFDHRVKAYEKKKRSREKRHTLKGTTLVEINETMYLSSTQRISLLSQHYDHNPPLDSERK